MSIKKSEEVKTQTIIFAAAAAIKTIMYDFIDLKQPDVIKTAQPRGARCSIDKNGILIKNKHKDVQTAITINVDFEMLKVFCSAAFPLSSDIFYSAT